jgi:hypothetical protein
MIFSVLLSTPSVFVLSYEIGTHVLTVSSSALLINNDDYIIMIRLDESGSPRWLAIGSLVGLAMFRTGRDIKCHSSSWPRVALGSHGVRNV